MHICVDYLFKIFLEAVKLYSPKRTRLTACRNISRGCTTCIFLRSNGVRDFLASAQDSAFFLRFFSPFSRLFYQRKIVRFLYFYGTCAASEKTQTCTLVSSRKMWVKS